MRGFEIGLSYPFSGLLRACVSFVPSPNKASCCSSYCKSSFCSVIILENSLDSLFKEGLLEYATCLFRW